MPLSEEQSKVYTRSQAAKKHGEARAAQPPPAPTSANDDLPVKDNLPAKKAPAKKKMAPAAKKKAVPAKKAAPAKKVKTAGASTKNKNGVSASTASPSRSKRKADEVKAKRIRQEEIAAKVAGKKAAAASSESPLTPITSDDEEGSEAEGPKPETRQATVTGVYGRWGSEWMELWQAEDDYWHSDEAVHAYMALLGITDIQPLTHCEDHLFPTVAVLWGLELHTVDDGEKFTYMTHGGRGPSCYLTADGRKSSCHNKNCAFPFLYLARGFRTLICRFDPVEGFIGACAVCFYSGITGCTLLGYRLPWLGDLPYTPEELVAAKRARNRLYKAPAGGFEGLMQTTTLLPKPDFSDYQYWMNCSKRVENPSEQDPNRASQTDATAKQSKSTAPDDNAEDTVDSPPRASSEDTRRGSGKRARDTEDINSSGSRSKKIQRGTPATNGTEPAAESETSSKPKKKPLDASDMTEKMIQELSRSKIDDSEEESDSDDSDEESESGVKRDSEPEADSDDDDEAKSQSSGKSEDFTSAAMDGEEKTTEAGGSDVDMKDETGERSPVPDHGDDDTNSNPGAEENPEASRQPSPSDSKTDENAIEDTIEQALDIFSEPAAKKVFLPRVGKPAPSDRESTSNDREFTSNDREPAPKDRESTSNDRESTSNDRESTSNDREPAPKDRAAEAVAPNDSKAKAEEPQGEPHHEWEGAFSRKPEGVGSSSAATQGMSSKEIAEDMQTLVNLQKESVREGEEQIAQAIKVYLDQLKEYKGEREVKTKQLQSIAERFNRNMKVLAENERENRRLKSELKVKDELIDDLHGQVSEHEKAKHLEQKEHTRLKGVLEQREKIYGETRKMYAANRGELKRLEQEKKMLEEENIKTAADRDRFFQLGSSLKTSWDDQKRRITELEGSAGSEKDRTAMLEQSVETQKDAITELEGMVQSQKDFIAELEQKLESSMQETQAATAQYEDLVIETQGLRARVTDLEQQLSNGAGASQLQSSDHQGPGSKASSAPPSTSPRLPSPRPSSRAPSPSVGNMPSPGLQLPSEQQQGSAEGQTSHQSSSVSQPSTGSDPFSEFDTLQKPTETPGPTSSSFGGTGGNPFHAPFQPAAGSAPNASGVVPLPIPGPSGTD